MLTKTREMCAFLCLQIAEVWYKCFQKMAHPDKPSTCFIRKSSHSIYDCRTMTKGVASTVMSQSATTDWIKLSGCSFSPKAGREFIVVAACSVPNRNAFNKSFRHPFKSLSYATKLSYATASPHASDDSHELWGQYKKNEKTAWCQTAELNSIGTMLIHTQHSSFNFSDCGNQGTELSLVWLAQLTCLFTD